MPPSLLDELAIALDELDSNSSACTEKGLPLKEMHARLERREHLIKRVQELLAEWRESLTPSRGPMDEDED